MTQPMNVDFLGMLPETGLYATLLPSIVSILGGSSTLLAVGPVALISVMRLGRIANLVSQPVMIGFTNAAAIIIMASQLPSLVGIADLGAAGFCYAANRAVVAPRVALPSAIVGGGPLICLGSQTLNK